MVQSEGRCRSGWDRRYWRRLWRQKRNTEVNWKWFIFTMLSLNYSSEQYLGKVSLKVSSFCQDILKCQNLYVFKSISQSLLYTFHIPAASPPPPPPPEPPPAPPPESIYRHAIRHIVVYGYNSSQSTCLTTTGTHVPYRITQCYLPPDRGDIPAFTPAEASGTRLSNPRGMQGWVDLVRLLHTEMVYPPEDSHPPQY